MSRARAKKKPAKSRRPARAPEERAPATIVIAPQAGPQTRFLSTPADLAIYGGAAGGGKSYALLLGAAQWIDRPGYAGVIFRRTSPQIVGAGSLWEATQGIYRHLGGKPRQTPGLEWRFAANTLLEFRHLQHAKDVHEHQGKQYAFIGFDELTHFEESQFWYLVSRMRSTCGVRPHLRATCNPDPDSFVRRLIAWWIDDATGVVRPERSGVLRWFVRVGDSLVWADTRDELVGRYPGEQPLSLTFISARLDDNPALTKADPGYRSRLLSLPLVERSRLLGANWNIRAAAGLLFKRRWFQVVDEAPFKVMHTVRAWDKAASAPSPERPDPDWTRGARVSLLEGNCVYIEDMVGCQGRPHEVDALMHKTATADGKRVVVGVWQDPGQAGLVDVDHVRSLLFGWSVRTLKASKDKVSYANPWSSLAEGGKVYIRRAPWSDAFMAEAEAFPDGVHDDQIDAVSLAVQLLPGGIGAFIEAMRRAREDTKT